MVKKKKVKIVQRKNLNPFGDFITIQKSNIVKEKYTPSFIERNEPKNLTEIVGNSTTIISFKKWFRSKVEEEEVPPFCFIFGEHGVGKTITVKLMFKSFNFELIEFNETSNMDKNKIVDKINKILDNNGINKLIKNDKPKGIVIESVEKVLGESEKNIKKILSNKYCIKTPIVFISSNKTINSKNIFKKYSHCMRFRKPWPNETHDLANRIIKNEKIKISKKSIEYFIKKCDGDIRDFINKLNVANIGLTKIKLKDAKKIVAFMECDNFFEVNETVDNIFNKKSKITNTELYNQCESDTLLINFTLQENFVKFYNFDDVVTIAESVSDGDVFRSFMFDKQYWGMYNYIVNSNFCVPNHLSSNSSWVEQSKYKQSQYVTNRWPTVNNYNKGRMWYNETKTSIKGYNISMFIHKILMPQLIVNKKIVPEIIIKCKELGISYELLLKMYTFSLKKKKNLTKKIKENLKKLYE